MTQWHNNIFWHGKKIDIMHYQIMHVYRTSFETTLSSSGNKSNDLDGANSITDICSLQ